MHTSEVYLLTDTNKKTKVRKKLRKVRKEKKSKKTKADNLIPLLETPLQNNPGVTC